MCCSLCLCMACAVLSSVSLVYLTFIVYMPAKRELGSGLLELPVMCTTTTMRETDQCEQNQADKGSQSIYISIPEYNHNDDDLAGGEYFLGSRGKLMCVESGEMEGLSLY